jgi:nucleoside-diphosphate-sugar epimerase
MAGTLALTGATGFIGGTILRRALEAGWRVRALARRPQALAAHEALTPIAGDLENGPALDRLLDGADAMVHAAGLVAARRAEEFRRTNARATAQLTARAAKLAAPPRFLLLSSLAAREPHLSPYAASKCAAEAALRGVGPRLEWTVLRPPVVYGPGDRATLPLFRQFRRGLLLRPAGDGRFSMLYVDDLADLALAWAGGPPAPGAIVEPDDGQPGGYGWAEVVAVASAAMNRRIRDVPLPPAVLRAAALAVEAACLATGRPAFLSRGKIAEALHPDWVCRGQVRGNVAGWRPKTGLDEGFRRTIAWYTANRWL